MPSKPLFGSHINPACQHCVHAIGAVSGKGQILCEKRGVVSGGYSCVRYRYDPIKRVPQRPRPLMSFTAEDFSIAINLEEEITENEKTETV